MAARQSENEWKPSMIAKMPEDTRNAWLLAADIKYSWNFSLGKHSQSKRKYIDTYDLLISDNLNRKLGWNGIGREIYVRNSTREYELIFHTPTGPIEYSKEKNLTLPSLIHTIHDLEAVLNFAAARYICLGVTFPDSLRGPNSADFRRLANIHRGEVCEEDQFSSSCQRVICHKVKGPHQRNTAQQERCKSCVTMRNSIQTYVRRLQEKAKISVTESFSEERICTPEEKTLIKEAAKKLSDLPPTEPLLAENTYGSLDFFREQAKLIERGDKPKYSAGLLTTAAMIRTVIGSSRYEKVRSLNLLSLPHRITLDRHFQLLPPPS